METLLPPVVGFLFAASLFMMLRHNLVKVALGLTLLTNATNLLLFTAGRLTKAVPPLIEEGHPPATPMANPVSQALILTAIVIGFGLLSFTLALVYRAYKNLHTVDPDELRTAVHTEASRL